MQRFESVAVHLTVAIGSFVILVSLCRVVDLFPGDLIALIAIPMVVCHGCALLLSLLFSKWDLRTCAVVFFVAFTIPGVFIISYGVRSQLALLGAVNDRFRQHLASPIPTSVTDLEFVPTSESRSTDLMFRFKIQAKDLNDVINKLPLKRQSQNSLDDPNDMFRDAGYLPVGNGPQYFQGTDQFGEIITIKCNGAMTYAIARRSHQHKAD